jgi:hypothetical protein
MSGGAIWRSYQVFAIWTLLAAACSPDDHRQVFAEQMARLVQAGVAHDECVASDWYSQQRGDTPLEWSMPTEIDRQLHTPGANSECKATLRLLEESATQNGLFRTYRCEFRGQQVEVSFSVARNDRDRDLFTWCEYALSGSEPFEDTEIYTRTRER